MSCLPAGYDAWRTACPDDERDPIAEAAEREEYEDYKADLALSDPDYEPYYGD